MDRIPEYVVTIDELWLAFLLGTALPAVTGFVTQRFASGTVKSLTLLALSLITGGASSLVATGGEFELKAAAIGFFITFITGVATHFGFLKPAGVTGKDGAIARAVPGGIGSTDPAQVAESQADAAHATPANTAGVGEGNDVAGETSWAPSTYHRPTDRTP